MKIFPGGSFLQITQGVGTPVRPNSGGATNSAGAAPQQFADQLRGAGQVQQIAPARQIAETILAANSQAGIPQAGNPLADGPKTGAPPRDLPRGSFINIRV